MSAEIMHEPIHMTLRSAALPGALARIACAVGLIVAGFAGLAFLFDAQATGPGKLQVNEAVTGFMGTIALIAARVGFCIALMVEVILYVFVRSRVSWKTLLWLVPVMWAAAGAALVRVALRLEELDIIPKAVMLMVGGGVVLFLAVSMQATLWQAAFRVAPDVNDFPFAWYLVLVMMMSAFFGGFRGWTDTSPMVRRVLEYRKQQWTGERPVDNGRPAPEAWIE